MACVCARPCLSGMDVSVWERLQSYRYLCMSVTYASVYVGRGRDRMCASDWVLLSKSGLCLRNRGESIFGLSFCCCSLPCCKTFYEEDFDTSCRQYWINFDAKMWSNFDRVLIEINVDISKNCYSILKLPRLHTRGIKIFFSVIKHVGFQKV